MQLYTHLGFVHHPHTLHSLVQIQKANMEFFMALGMGLYSHIPAPQNTDFVVVVSGETCTPCQTLMQLMEPVKDISGQPQISAAWTGQASPLLHLSLTSILRCSGDTAVKLLSLDFGAPYLYAPRLVLTELWLQGMLPHGRH